MIHSQPHNRRFHVPAVRGVAHEWHTRWRCSDRRQNHDFGEHQGTGCRCTVPVSRVPPGCAALFFVQIFARNIVLRHLVRANFLLVSVVSAFDTSHDVGFECIPFLDQLVNALRIGSFEAGQPL